MTVEGANRFLKLLSDLYINAGYGIHTHAHTYKKNEFKTKRKVISGRVAVTPINLQHSSGYQNTRLGPSAFHPGWGRGS